ncbi:hypothetical protein GBA52_028421 [Prunus armeniaca]|nr:hypothetical protein GBA52_028421 [Prunus armeniaca]
MQKAELAFRFGEEAEEEEKELAAVKTKIKSSHDVLDDPRLLKDEVPNNDVGSSKLKERRARKDSESKFYNTLNYSDDDDDEANFDARMRQQILRKRKDLGDLPPKPKMQNESLHFLLARSIVESINDDQQKKVEKLSLKKKGIGSEARAERMANADADLQLLGEAERGRQLQKQKKRRNQGREDDVLAKLEKFKKGIFESRTASGSESGGGKDEDASDWKAVRLKFAPESGKDRMSRNEDPNDYVVYDPLLEKGKEKFNRCKPSKKRREREWAGKSLT